MIFSYHTAIVSPNTCTKTFYYLLPITEYHRLVKQYDPFEMKQLPLVLVSDFLIDGPFFHYYYKWLDDKIKGTKAKHVVAKVAFDQLVRYPIYAMLCNSFLALCSGGGIGVIADSVKKQLLKRWQEPWAVCLFFVLQTVNFKLISNKHRVLFFNALNGCAGRFRPACLCVWMLAWFMLEKFHKNSHAQD